jgi:hypothetical protein
LTRGNETPGRPPRWRGLLGAIWLGAILAGVAACSGSVATPSSSPAATATPIATPSPIATDSPTPSATFTPWATLSPTPTPSGTPATGTWTLDLYNARAVRWQDPDMTACVAASTQMMLNMAVYWQDYTPASGQPEPVRPELWKPTVTYASQEAILAYARKNTTQTLKDGGADAHGWRNSLNYFGWGHNSSLVFRDLTYTSFDGAAKATVSAIALYRKPVGILAWAGQHAQIVNGYKVTGEDPRTGSTNFTILGVYLTDSLKADGYRNTYIPLASWQSGGKKIRFVTYQMTNSPFVDPIDLQQGNAEWDGKWVIVAPVA